MELKKWRYQAAGFNSHPGATSNSAASSSGSIPTPSTPQSAEGMPWLSGWWLTYPSEK